MTRVLGFNSFEDELAYMRKAEEDALKRLTDSQRDLMNDCDTRRYYARPYDEFIIFGEVWSHAESDESERKCGATAREAKDTAARLAESRQRGWLFGRHYSIAVPDGEIGSTHAADVVPITKEVFDLARRERWRILRGTAGGLDLSIALVAAADANGCPPEVPDDA